MLVFQNGSYLPAVGPFTAGDVAVENGRIREVGRFTGEGGQRLDAGGLYVIPGLIDIHTHGALGYDASLTDAEGFARLSDFYARGGVTSFMATTITDSMENLCRSIDRIRAAAEREQPSAAILGVHTEGPFLSPAHAGCHDPRLLQAPQLDALREMARRLGKNLKLRVTIAPELPGAMDFISETVKLGGSVGIGHTDADEKTALEALRHGANAFTHLFNAMRGIHHREPGCAGEGLLSDAFVELICDGVHLHPDIVKMVYKMKGAAKIVAVTDSLPATGLPDGHVVFGGVDVEVKNGIARTNDGTLAGSTLLLRDAVLNIARFTGMSLEDAVRMATINPARVVGLEDEIGSVEPGKRADLVVVDGGFHIKAVVCRGNLVYTELDRVGA